MNLKSHLTESELFSSDSFQFLMILLQKFCNNFLLISCTHCIYVRYIYFSYLQLFILGFPSHYHLYEPLLWLYRESKVTAN